MSQIKTNTTALQDILNAASNLPKPIDTSDATATSSKILSGYTAYVDNKMIAGNIPNKTGNDVSVNGNTVNIPAGNYENDVLKSIPSNGDVSKTIDGIDTKSVTIPAGYTSGGTVSLDSSIDNAVSAAIAALVEKGVEVPDGTTVAGLAALIASITGMSEINGLKVYTGTVIPAVDDGLIYLTKSGDSIHSEVYAILNGNNNYRYYASVFLMSDYDVTNYETLYVTKNQHYHDGTRTYAISRARVQNNTITIDTSKDETGGNNMNITYYPRSGQTMPYTFCKSNYTFKAGKIYGWFIIGERLE